LAARTVLLSGCSWSEAIALGWPEGITPEAHLKPGTVDRLADRLAGGRCDRVGLIFWASAFHRHKKGDTELPRQFGYNMPLELVLTVVPFLIISVLFYFTVVVQEKILHKDPNPEVVIDVTAFQVELVSSATRRSTSATGTSATTASTMSARPRWSPSPRARTRMARRSVGAVRGLNTRIGISVTIRRRCQFPDPSSG